VALRASPKVLLVLFMRENGQGRPAERHFIGSQERNGQGSTENESGEYLQHEILLR
jgi:hypothetical protein